MLPSESLQVRIGNVAFVLSRCRFLSSRIGNNCPQVTCSPTNQLSSQTKQQGLPTCGLLPGRGNVTCEVPLFPLKMASCCFTTVVLAQWRRLSGSHNSCPVKSGDDRFFPSPTQRQPNRQGANPPPFSRLMISTILSEHSLVIISCGCPKTRTCENTLFSILSSAK